MFAAPSLSPAYAGLDCEGHGTHVAAVVGGLQFGVAKAATLHAVRILDCKGNGAGGGGGAGPASAGASWGLPSRLHALWGLSVRTGVCALPLPKAGAMRRRR